MVKTKDDLELFHELTENLDVKPQCENEVCDRDAELIIHCYQCRNETFEFSCKECYLVLTAIDAVIIFTDKCGHQVEIKSCTVVEI